MDFIQLGVTPCLIKCLEKRSISKATDIQTKIIPHLAAGESVLFTSATGTGKTFAYLLPILSKLLETQEPENTDNFKGPFFVIIAPTLELCTQIKSELDFLTQEINIRSSLLIGSFNIDTQIEKLKKTRPNVVVGNPGRLLVLAKMGILKLSNVQFLVIDEADRLVSDELLDETSELCKIIWKYTGKAKTNLVFAACSATINKKNREKLLFNFYNKSKNHDDIKFIESDDQEILREKIEHWAIFTERRRKDQTLRSLLSALNTKKSKVKALIFTSRNDEALFALSRLQHHNVSAAGLFGKAGKKPISSADRKIALDSFRDGNVMALVSTDLAARGLHIQGITHVIALDVPADSEVYIHRSGRQLAPVKGAL